jgi:N-acetylmuramoyl-L-alanine amidase
MRLRPSPQLVLLPLAAAALLWVPSTARADFVHTVLPGESLTSVAAADGLTVAQLAAANGLSPYARLVIGSSLMIPPQDGDGDTDDESSTATALPSSTAGSYVVQPGDTLTAIAARAGTSVAQLAAANRLDPNGVLLSGTVLRLGEGTQLLSDQTGSSNPATSQPVGAVAEGSPTAPPYPTRERLTASQIGQIAAYEGVPAALAEAIAWQESGFNNGLVSSADARGIMQILPGTWNWIGQNLATPPPLGTASAAQNVRAGTLLLHSLLQATGGNQQLAAAGYFQGLPSVQQNGMYPATQQYVNDVMSLERQFGGG